MYLLLEAPHPVKNLATKAGTCGSSCELFLKFMKQVMKCGVIDMILYWARAKQKVDLGHRVVPRM